MFEIHINYPKRMNHPDLFKSHHEMIKIMVASSQMKKQTINK